MWAASRYFNPRFWATRYWFKTGSDIAHTLSAVVFLVPGRAQLNVARRAVLVAPARARLTVPQRDALLVAPRAALTVDGGRHG
jgi:hypothetical protein